MRRSASGCRASQASSGGSGPVYSSVSRRCPGSQRRRPRWQAAAPTGWSNRARMTPALAQLGHVCTWTSRPRWRIADAVADLFHLGQDVRREQHRLALCPCLPHLVQQFVAHGRVEGVGRLVHDDQRRRAAPAPAAAPPCASCRTTGWRWAGPGRCRSGGRGRPASASTGWPRSRPRKLDELPAGHVLVQAQFAGQVGDVPAGGDAVVPAVVAGDGRGRPSAAGNPAAGAGRCLAGAVGAEQAEHLARRDVQVEVVEGAEAAVVLGQVFGRCS